MEILRTIFLGFTQGSTEFLPVSSSGHLVLFEQILAGFTHQDLFLDIMLHIGTLVAVVVFCRREVAMLFRALLHFHRSPRNEREQEERRLFFAVLVASIPTAIIGLLIKLTIVDQFSNYFFLAATFMVTTIALSFSYRLRGRDTEFSLRSAAIIGIVQGFAVLPGISRAGVTIVAGQATGLERSRAARFAFVISIPAILGAALLSFLDATNLPNFNTSLIFSLLCGMMSAAIVGYLSLVLLTKIIEKAKLSYFAFYTAAVSIFCLILGFVH